jgi:hypothetical protein
MITALEFCPRCGNPICVLEAEDASRLCAVCAWFGDVSETLPQPPVTSNSETGARQAIALYRSVCRTEFFCEAACQQEQLPFGVLLRIKAMVSEAEAALLTLFRNASAIAHAPAAVLKRDENGWVPWPEDWTDYRKVDDEPCNMLVGPCSCGAWHCESEDWVQEKLRQHNVAIEPEM